MIDFSQITGFDWADGNSRKNEKHSVSAAEAEQVFFHDPLLVLNDGVYSQSEPRYHALGEAPGTLFICRLFPFFLLLLG